MSPLGASAVERPKTGILDQGATETGPVCPYAVLCAFLADGVSCWMVILFSFVIRLRILSVVKSDV